MAITMSPLDLTDTDQTLMAVLQRIGDLQQQPLIPDNPMAQLGAALTGFSSGVQGKPNPAITQAQTQRAQDLRLLTTTGALTGQLSAIKERGEARKFQREKFEFDKVTQGATTARGLIDTAMKIGDTDGIAYGLLQLSAITGTGPKTMDDARAIAKDTVLREQIGKNGRELAVYALNGIEDPRIPQQMLDLAQKNPAALRSAYKIENPEKEIANLAKAQEDAKAAAFKNRIQTRELELRRKPGLLPNETLELDAITSLRSTPIKTEAMEVARFYMEKDPRIPLDMALSRAHRILANATDRPSDLRRVAADLRRVNPQMTEGEAILEAAKRFTVMRERVQSEEDSATQIVDVLQNLEFYSDRVRAAGLFQRILAAPGQTLGSLTGSDPDIKGLQRQIGYIGLVARQMGQRGNLSEPEQRRVMELLDTSVYADAKIAKAGIAELRQILLKGMERRRQRRAGAAQIVPDAQNPLGLDPALLGRQ